MPILKTFNEQTEHARHSLGRFRQRYLGLYSKALEAGSGRLEDLLRLSESVSPRIRDLLEGRVSRLQAQLDELNQSLAQRAVPLDRKARVGRMSLDDKARRAGQAGLRVVADNDGSEGSGGDKVRGEAGSRRRSGQAARSGASGGGKGKAPAAKKTASAGKSGTGKRAAAAKRGTKSDSARGRKGGSAGKAAAGKKATD